MAVISEIEGPHRFTRRFKIEPWFFDHRFNGKPVLPAVEEMEFVASFIQKEFPAFNCRAILNARFDRFLALDPALHEIDFILETTISPESRISVSLNTQVSLAGGTIMRKKEHAVMTFADDVVPEEPPPSQKNKMKTEEKPFIIESSRVYDEMVTFGAAYRNITGAAEVSRSLATAGVRAPALAAGAVLGSPFPLDAAFHAACLWGQRYHGIVALPAAIEKRLVFNKTEPDNIYLTEIYPLGEKNGILTFDLNITGNEGTLYEKIQGLKMRDVSGGRLTAPKWIVKGESPVS